MKHEDILKITEEYHFNTDDNVVGVGYGYKTVNGIVTNEKSIVFTVKEKVAKEDLTEDQLLPKTININDTFLRTDVIQGTYELISCDPNFQNWQTTPPSTRNKFRPLKGGVSTTNYTSLSGYVGTLGFLAKDNDTNSLIGVTNSHVLVDDAFLCSDRSPVGTISNINNDSVVQPHPIDGAYFGNGGVNPIGVVKKYYPLQIPPVYNYIDVSLTTIDSSVVNSTSYQQEGLTTSALTFASTSEINNILSSNPLLYSAGRTTGSKGEGLTKLRAYSFPITISINYNKQGVATTVYMSDCIGFIAVSGSTVLPPYTEGCYNPISAGDSGSALIADFGGTKKIIGLVFAGSGDDIGTTLGIACRIDRIASLMNISEWNGETINYSNVANALELDIPGLDPRPYIDHIDGKRYWQVGLKNI
jgi:hypothetical protein